MNPFPLICVPSPRDIPIIKKALHSIEEYDKLWIKYSPEHISYPIMRNEFLKNDHRKYTHLVICPDDLLIDDKNKLKLLLDDAQKLGDKAILSGYCNVDTTDNAIYANVTQYDVSSERPDRTYEWLTLEELESRNKSNFLIEVKFSGFALMVIPRSAVEQIPFRNDSSSGKFDNNGCCVDVMFCNDALKKGYKLFVDTRVRLQHLKYNETSTAALIKQQAKTAKDYHYYYDYSTLYL